LWDIINFCYLSLNEVSKNGFLKNSWKKFKNYANDCITKRFRKNLNFSVWQVTITGSLKILFLKAREKTHLFKKNILGLILGGRKLIVRCESREGGWVTTWYIHSKVGVLWGFTTQHNKHVRSHFMLSLLLFCMIDARI